MSVTNDRENFLRELKQSSEVTITVTRRKTKKKFSTPVWFVLDNSNKVILLPIKGSESNWFKNLAVDPLIELSVGKNTIPLRARLRRDRDQVKKIIDNFKAKYPSGWERSEKYYVNRDAYAEIPV